MTKIKERSFRHLPMEFTIGRYRHITESHVQPGCEVSEADVGIYMRRPRYGERRHFVARFQFIGYKDTVLPPTAWNNYVKLPAFAAMFI